MFLWRNGCRICWGHVKGRDGGGEEIFWKVLTVVKHNCENILPWIDVNIIDERIHSTEKYIRGLVFSFECIE